MKFFCEYCGNRIDALKDAKCPHCGASYKKNKSFIKLEEESKKQTQIQNENKQKVFNHVLGTLKFSRWFLLIPIVMFIIVFIIVFLSFGKIGKFVGSQIENNKNDQIKTEENITVNFDEYAETSEYKVKVNKYEVIEDKFNRLDEGYEYIKFYLIVENLTNDEIRSEDVNCIVDGIAQENYYYSGHSELPFNINKGLAVKGTSTFIVPKDATSYDIRYGDYVTVHIEK